jgi:hypothetical protein
MHCTCGFGRTGTMIMSYLMYKIYKDTHRFIKPQNLDKYTKLEEFEEYTTPEKFEELFDISSRIRYALQKSSFESINALMKTDIMKYIKDQILNNYSKISYYEIVKDKSGSSYLMLKRLSIIIETIYSLFDD